MGYSLFNEDVKLLLDGPLSLVKQNLCTGEEAEVKNELLLSSMHSQQKSSVRYVQTGLYLPICSCYSSPADGNMNPSKITLQQIVPQAEEGKAKRCGHAPMCPRSAAVSTDF